VGAVCPFSENILCTAYELWKNWFKLGVVLLMLSAPRENRRSTPFIHLLNFIPMVTTDISQLSAECNTWRQTMRNYRDEFTQLQQQLRKVAAPVSQKELLQDVEHYENQFHIQLINIHDIKHSIKAHQHQASQEMTRNNGQVNDNTWVKHEQLNDDYHRLDHMLQELKSDFNQFLQRVKN
jgi:DNA anti-recombination protein RmuC